MLYDFIKMMRGNHLFTEPVVEEEDKASEKKLSRSSSQVSGEDEIMKIIIIMYNATIYESLVATFSLIQKRWLSFDENVLFIFSPHQCPPGKTQLWRLIGKWRRKFWNWDRRGKTNYWQSNFQIWTQLGRDLFSLIRLISINIHIACIAIFLFFYSIVLSILHLIKSSLAIQ